MSGPWEKYQAPTKAAEEGPWSRFGGAPALAGKVLDEAHPDISAIDRAAAQNFASTPQEKIDYLKKNYPGYDIREAPADPGKIAIKGPKETDYRLLSPHFHADLATLKDLPQTALDNAYNIGVSGPAIGITSTAGALAGTGIAPGPGTVAGAAAGGAAAGRLAEGARQSIGHILGFGDVGKFNEDELGNATVAGGAAPVLFGAGKAFRGAIPAVAGKALPALGELLSGVPAKALKTTAEDTAAVGALATPKAQGEFIQGLKKSVMDKVQGAATETGGALESTARAATAEVPLSAALDPLAAYRAGLAERQGAFPTPATASKIAEVDKIIGEHGLVQPGRETVDPMNAWRISQDLKNLADAAKGYKPAPGAAPHDVALMNAVKDAGFGLADAVSEVTGGKLNELNKAYSPIKKDLKVLNKFFGSDDQATASALANLPNASKATKLAKIQQIDAKYGTGLEKAADLLHASKYMADPSFLPISSKGTTSTSRTLVDSLLGPAATAGKALMAPLSGPMAQKTYIQAGNTVLKPLLNNPVALQSFLQASRVTPTAGQAVQKPFDMLQQYIGGQK